MINDYYADDEIEEEEQSSSSSSGDSATSQAVKKYGKQGAQKAGRAATKAGGQAAKKGAGLLAKGGAKIGMLAGKALAGLIASCSAFIIPALIIVLIVIVVLIVCYGAWDMTMNSRGKSQDYQQTDIYEYNQVERNEETGEYEAIDLSFGNKVVQAFYTYFSERSIWITSDDMNIDEPIQYNSPEFISRFGEDGVREQFRDKYGREKMFYISPDALWSLDTFLNKGDFIFPEQFIQPVYNEGEGKQYALKQLTDSDGNLVAQSQKYQADTENNEFVPAGAETEAGVWDYGFGSILNYKKFIEEAKRVGRYETIEVWNVESQAVETVSLAEAKAGSVTGKYEAFQDFEGKVYEEAIPSANKTSYMIDRVTSPSGTISNKIEHQFEDSGEPFSASTTRNASVTIKFINTRTLTKQVTLACNETRRVYTYKDVDGKWSEPQTISNPCVLEDEDSDFADIPPKTYSYTVTEEFEDTRKETRAFSAYATGTIHRKIPRYVGNPDTSAITGNQYYEDYIRNYESYVPDSVLSGFDFKSLRERTGKDAEELLELLDRESFGAGSTGSVDMDSFELGSGASSQSFKNAVQYLNYFQKYGEMYGVDPYLLIAIAAQESGGKHDAYISASRCQSAGCGIMQIEQPGITITSASAYNQHTKQVDEVTVTHASVSQVEENIKVGAMLASSRMKAQDYNLFIGLQSYNYGTGAFDKALHAYCTLTGKTPEAVRADLTDLGWMVQVKDLHENPGKYLSNWSYPTYGDPNYIANVLRYYASPSKDGVWLAKEDGSKVTVAADGMFSIGSSTGVASSDNWISKGWQTIKDKFTSTLFPSVPDELAKERQYFEHKPTEKQTSDIIKMMFAMEEGKYLTDYEDFTPESWKEKFTLLFSNPVGTNWSAGVGTGVQDKGYFPNGYQPPLPFSPLKIKTNYSTGHMAIDIVAPINTAVSAVADGEVIEVSRSSERGYYIRIKHANGVETVYGNLKGASVKAGDKVKQGQGIGFTDDSASQGAVLHFELWKDGKPESPVWMVSKFFSRPTTGPITLEYMSTESPYSPTRPHLGVDYGVPVGTGVVAVTDGEVITASMGDNGGYGNMIVIKHNVNGKAMVSIYGHLSTIQVTVGQKVTSGQRIGLSGNTGASTGPHLHIELLSGISSMPMDRNERMKYTVNPLQYF